MSRKESRGGSDKDLQALLAQRAELDVKIREKQQEHKREQRLLVDSIDRLKCKKHPGARYEVLTNIPNSFGGLQTYICSDCRTEHPRVPLELINSLDISVAHDCPDCGGIVVGSVVREQYKSSEESWRNLAGREGTHYKCGQCKALLGHKYFKMS